MNRPEPEERRPAQSAGRRSFPFKAGDVDGELPVIAVPATPAPRARREDAAGSVADRPPIAGDLGGMPPDGSAITSQMLASGRSIGYPRIVKFLATCPAPSPPHPR